jgi:hypothetical protein
VARFETLDPEIRGVLGKKVSELGLRVEGSPVEGYVRQLYKELDRRGLKRFRPVCYLTDEWGCPDQQPVLGIPFYLADPKLQTIEKAADALENERQIMMYMRHEAGHVFNYAYRLYTTSEWRVLFGPFFRTYRDEYRPVPFSKHFVRHIEGWYAQKHPDEDFAETFAVWLTPRSPWRRQYKGWPAMRKLRYVERVARKLADVEPIVKTGEVDVTPDDISVTVEQFYEQAAQEQQARIDPTFARIPSNTVTALLTSSAKVHEPRMSRLESANGPITATDETFGSLLVSGSRLPSLRSSTIER